jgi:hypothetical protein
MEMSKEQRDEVGSLEVVDVRAYNSLPSLTEGGVVNEVRYIDVE